MTGLIAKITKTRPTGSYLRPVLLAALIATGIAGFRWTPLAVYLEKDFLLAFISNVRGIWHCCPT